MSLLDDTSARAPDVFELLEADDDLDALRRAMLTFDRDRTRMIDATESFVIGGQFTVDGDADRPYGERRETLMGDAF